MSSKSPEHPLKSRAKCQLLEIGTYLSKPSMTRTSVFGYYQCNIHVNQRRSQLEKFAPTASRSRVSFECWLSCTCNSSSQPNGTRCPNRAAIEITRYIKIDAKTGEIEIPDGSRFVRPFSNDLSQDYHSWNSSLPKGKDWVDVHLYSKSEQ